MNYNENSDLLEPIGNRGVNVVYLDKTNKKVVKPLDPSWDNEKNYLWVCNEMLNLGVSSKVEISGDYIVSDYIDGLTLWEHRSTSVITHDLFYAIMKVRKIMHLAGVAHNDLHDDNIIITSDNQVKFIDFVESSIGYSSVVNELYKDWQFEEYVCELLPFVIEDKYYSNQERMRKTSIDDDLEYIKEYYRGLGL